MATPNPPTEPVHRYPGGESDPAYRWAFTAWIILFLGVICLGLLGYLGLYLKTYWPNL